MLADVSCLVFENLPSSLAVNTLGLGSTDDDVGEGGTILKNEHGILLTSLILTLADRSYQDVSVVRNRHKKTHGFARIASCHHRSCP